MNQYTSYLLTMPNTNERLELEDLRRATKVIARTLVDLLPE